LDLPQEFQRAGAAGSDLPVEITSQWDASAFLRRREEVPQPAERALPLLRVGRNTGGENQKQYQDEFPHSDSSGLLVDRGCQFNAQIYRNGSFLCDSSASSASRR
jgi:hypothetical protein